MKVSIFARSQIPSQTSINYSPVWSIVSLVWKFENEEKNLVIVAELKEKSVQHPWRR